MEETKSRSIDFEVKPLIPPEHAIKLDEPLKVEVKCKRCGQHLGYYGDYESPADSSKNTQAIALICELHRVGHLLEDLLAHGIKVEKTPPVW